MKLASLATAGVVLAAPTVMRADRPSQAAFAVPAVLRPLPVKPVQMCRRLQARVRFTVLCPERLPRATLGWPKASDPPPLKAEVNGDPSHPGRSSPLGLSFGYGAPVEPDSHGGGWWRSHVWLNRPAFFLHFTIWRRGDEPLPRPLARRCFGTRCGLVRYATGYGLQGSTGLYWSNHTWFFWREAGRRYAASLHYFGRVQTTALLARIMRGLRPARRLR